MAKRIAGALSLVAFTLCLATGWQAENSFGTTVSRALLAMVVTLIVGLIIGAMGEKMLEENLKSKKEVKMGDMKGL